MKKLIIALFISINCYCQEDKFLDNPDPSELVGKVVENKRDDFTNDYTVQVNAMRGNRFKNGDKLTEGLFVEPIFLSTFYRITTSKKFAYINLEILQRPSFDNYCVSDYDGQLFIMLDNKEIIKLKQFSEVDCDTTLDPKYNLSIEDLNKLTTHKIDKIRIYYTKGYGDYTIREDKKALVLSTFQVLKEQISRIIQ